MRSRSILLLVVLAGLTALPVAGLKARENEKKELQGRTPYKVYFIGHSLYSAGMSLPRCSSCRKRRTSTGRSRPPYTFEAAERTRITGRLQK